MASTTSDSLGVELIAYGERANEWGSILNTGLRILERATAGHISVAVSSPSVTLSATDFALGDWHNHAIRFTGTLTANSVVTLPAREKSYLLYNATTGAFTLTVQPSGGTGITIPQGAWAVAVCDGTNISGTVLQPYNSNLSALAGANGTLTAYRETRVAGAASATTVLDLASANIFEVSQAVSITSLTFANAPPAGTAYSFTLIRRKDATATARAITWPTSVKWSAGLAPTLTQTASGVDAFSFLTTDGGTTWLGFTAGTDIR
jgi:hypothetical protein